MEDDLKPLLVNCVEEDIIKIDTSSDSSLDPRSKRPFHVEAKNIVSIDCKTQERVSAEASAMNKRIQYYNRLSAASNGALIPPDHVLPEAKEIYVYSPLGTALKIKDQPDGSGTNSSIITIFTIWNTMMGTSILSMPWGIKQAGFTFGILITFLMGLLTLYCCYRVVKSRQAIPLIDTSNWEFPDVCKYYFGPFGHWSSLAFSMVSLIGAMVVYWVLMSNFLFNTGKFIHNHIYDLNVTDHFPATNGSEKVICPYPPNHQRNSSLNLQTSSPNEVETLEFNKWWSKTKTVPLYLVLILLPLLNFKSASFFARFNVLGTASVLYLVVLVTWKAAHLGFHLECHWFTSTYYFVPEFRVFFPQLTGTLTLAFFIHNCIITLLKNNKNQENNVRDLSIAYLLVGLTYLYVGVLIFATFPSPPLPKDCIEPNFLDNFPSTDILVFVARMFLLFQMTTVYPMLGYLVRVQLLGQLFGNTYPSIFHVLLLNIMLVGVGITMARFYPNIGGIIRYSGATCGLAFVFVYPSLTHMISLHQTGQLKWPSAIFHSFLIVLGVANVVAQFFM
ncbi:neutral amino acid transporter 9 [Latimeria chalumnae]|nr:PREDICTED: sodium-coupled neutral amino acid transporter 9 [Latimeria chalumnae]|eukprot:XP_005998499.1 PREDICTED: sodium-coupled neutral amino acid transporter 9 [Latimeria chalumnae]